MSRPRLPPRRRRDDFPELDATGCAESSEIDGGSDDESPDCPDDFDEHLPIDLSPLGALLDADDDDDPVPEQGDFWIERDDA